MKHPYRIGIGWDVHPFAPQRKLILGGVQIPYEKGLEGHSDADVLVHAVMDSLLGAAGMPDIGELFPNTNMEYKGADSLELLRKVNDRLRLEHWFLVNIDCVLLCEEPKIKPYKEQMKDNLARALEVHKENVNIKATTTEKLGFIGRKEGIAAEAVALLYLDK